MRTRLLLILILLFVTATAHAQEAEPALLEVAGVTLRLRSGPSTEDAIIGQLTPREAVELLERGEQWSQVRRQDGLTGWAHNDYLRPWDERNRPDTSRRVGERRLFRVPGKVSGQWRYADRHAVLRAVSAHSYLYSVARLADDALPDDKALVELGALFDEYVYQHALDLWGIGNPPDINGDERIVVLVASGFDPDKSLGGWYSARDGLPDEGNPAGIGFLGIALHEKGLYYQQDPPPFASLEISKLAHEFGHMLHHYTGDRNHSAWVKEGLASFTASYLWNVKDLSTTDFFQICHRSISCQTNS